MAKKVVRNIGRMTYSSLYYSLIVDLIDVSGNCSISLLVTKLILSFGFAKQ